MDIKPSMDQMILVAILACLYAQIECSVDRKWSFTGDDDGPTKWPSLFKTCNGYMQSPVALNYGQATYTNRMGQISIKKRKGAEDKQFTLQNTGNGVTLVFPENTYDIHIGAKKVNPLIQLHFHWGRGDEKGSEHTMNGKQADIELHVVMYNVDYYKDFNTALTSANGLACLVSLFNVDDSKPSFMDYLPGFIPALSKIQAPNTETKINNFDPSKWLEAMDVTKFYRYSGGLTSPPCTENVVWTIFSTIGTMKRSDIRALQSLNYDSKEKDKKMGHNWRPVNPFNKDGFLVQRVLYRSWNKASSVQTNILIISFTTLSAILYVN